MSQVSVLPRLKIPRLPSPSAGNPARVLRTGIEVGHYGRLKGADLMSRRTYDGEDI